MALRAADPRLATRVGAATIVLAVLGVVYFVYLRDKIFLAPSVTVRVYFQHAGPLQEGAPVQVAGRRVGTVSSIALVPRSATGEGHPLAATGGAVAIVKIDARRRHMVPVDGDWFVSSKGVLSERYLEVGPPADGREPGRPVRHGDEILGIDPPSMDRVLQNTWDNLQIARAFLEEVRPEASAFFAAVDELTVTLGTLEREPGEWQRLRDRVSQAALEAKLAYASLEAADARPEQIAALVERARGTIARGGVAFQMVRFQLDELSGALDRLGAQIERARPGLEQKLRAAIAAAERAFDRIEAVRGKVDELMAMVERGEGTIGRIRTDPEFPEDAKELGKILKRQPWKVIGHPQDDLDP